jgi:hypothetical protein
VFQSTLNCSRRSAATAIEAWDGALNVDNREDPTVELHASMRVALGPTGSCSASAKATLNVRDHARERISRWIYADDSSSSWTTAGGDFTATAIASKTFTFPFPLGTAYTWSSAGMVTDSPNLARVASDVFYNSSRLATD